MAAAGSFAHWLAKCLRATVITDIWFPVLLFSAWALVVQVISVYTAVSLSISSQLLTVLGPCTHLPSLEASETGLEHQLQLGGISSRILGTVLGLVISFRTSSAYERFSEGRKLWTTIQITSRNLAIVIWVHVPNDRPLKAGETTDPAQNRQLAAIIEKRSMINLVQAFSVSVKHMLRGEPGVYWEDLYPLISFLPRYSPQKGANKEDGNLPVWYQYGMNLRKAEESEGSSASGRKRRKSFDPEAALADVHSQYELGPARSPPKMTTYDILPPLIIFRPIVSLITLFVTGHFGTQDGAARTITGKRRKPAHIDSNVPMELTLFLNSYLAFLLKASLLAPATATAFNNGIVALQDAVANLDRVRNTPLPAPEDVFVVHHHRMYLFFLPFQVRDAYKWLVIPVVAFASFLMLGFLEIGQEIEDPFGYDLNDLPIDDICLAIHRELHEISAHPAPDPSTYIFSKNNQPFAPADRMSAAEIIGDPHHRYHSSETGMGSVYGTLLRSWREVNQHTRKGLRDVEY
ncbi:UPF0187-domain-containing protein [Auriculariales sp. MPI-PUGE-AT-0066]|nr:UPF0187-domain-containing protein [Auriculariales sp. MPI-PUGE-AT-0066]